MLPEYQALQARYQFLVELIRRARNAGAPDVIVTDIEALRDDVYAEMEVMLRTA